VKWRRSSVATSLTPRCSANAIKPSGRTLRRRSLRASATSARPARAAPKNAGGHGRESVSAKSGNSSPLGARLAEANRPDLPLAAPSHTESECHSCCARCDGSPSLCDGRAGVATASHSVAFGGSGWRRRPTRRAAARRGSTRLGPGRDLVLPLVKIRPLISRVASRPRKPVLAGWVLRSRGPLGEHDPRFPGVPRATRQSSPNPSPPRRWRTVLPIRRAAQVVRHSHLVWPAPVTSLPVPGPARGVVNGRVSSSARTGSAKTAALPSHSTTTWARTLQRPRLGRCLDGRGRSRSRTDVDLLRTAGPARGTPR
jgi:hypothetical protein